MSVKLPIVVLISGNGSNLQAMIDAQKQGLPINIRAVISNNPHAYGLARAQQAGIPTEIIPHTNFATRAQFDAALKITILRYQPQWIVLAGFMRRLESDIVNYFSGKMINIHPSLLPKYPGLHTHRKVLAAKEAWHGTTIHFVTDTVDGGPIICQAALKIQPTDDEESLKQKIQQIEHRMYPEALGWIAAGRVQMKNGRVEFDGKTLPKTGVQF